MTKSFIEMTLTVITAILAALGVYLLVVGTTDATAGRFLIPPEILPGVGVILFDAALVGFFTVRLMRPKFFFSKCNQLIKKKVGHTESQKLRNMALLLMLCIFGLAMTQGTTPMYAALSGNFILSLMVNIFISLITAIGIFGWSAYFFTPKNQEKLL